MKKYRSRLMLVFLFWLGGYAGLHHLWMGNKELALDEAKNFFKHVLMSMIVIGIPLMLMDMCKYLVNMIAVIFGKYETDYYGNPIVWIKAGKPDLN
ncbi:MAG: hypothetical protein K2H01_06870 [Ruminococcus sp.]|nr:hypothetical protein [Ruminococcus sp.]